MDVQPAITSDDEIVEAIVDELRKGGLTDARGLEQRQVIPLFKYVRTQVRISIWRVRRKDRLPEADRARFSMIRLLLRVATKALNGLAAVLPDPVAAAVRTMRDRLPWVEPPARMDALKYRCADEAFYLIETFSEAAPAGTPHGPFQTVAELLYEAARDMEGKNLPSLQNACDAVLRARRRHPRNIPDSPT